MKSKAFFITFKGLSSKQIKHPFLEGERESDFNSVSFLVKIHCLKPFNGQYPSHIETSQLICTANQLIGFYIRGTLIYLNYHSSIYDY